MKVDLEWGIRNNATRHADFVLMIEKYTQVKTNYIACNIAHGQRQTRKSHSTGAMMYQPPRQDTRIDSLTQDLKVNLDSQNRVAHLTRKKNVSACKTGYMSR